ncbi:uncharacterized protein AAEQ78_011842 isoform 1-T1 [Lycaon pictus]
MLVAKIRPRLYRLSPRWRPQRSEAGGRTRWKRCVRLTSPGHPHTCSRRIGAPADCGGAGVARRASRPCSLGGNAAPPRLQGQVQRHGKPRGSSGHRRASRRPETRRRLRGSCSSPRPGPWGPRGISLRPTSASTRARGGQWLGN